MGATDLLFAQAPATPALRFGDDQVGPRPPVNAQLRAELAPLQVAITVVPSVEGMLQVRLPDLGLAAGGAYASRAARPVVGKASTGWQPSQAREIGAQERSEATGRRLTSMVNRWALCVSCSDGVEIRQAGALAPLYRRNVSPYAEARRVPATPAGSPYEVATAIRRARSSAFQGATGGRHVARSNNFAGGTPTRRRWVGFHTAPVRRQRWCCSATWATTVAAAGWAFRTGWQEAQVPPPGSHPRPPLPPPVVACYQPSAYLRFRVAKRADADLWFACERGGERKDPVVVAVRRVYVVLNNVTLIRVTDGAELPTLSLSLALDVGSWTWGFEAELPGSAEALVIPTAGPVDLLARVNGAEFRLMVETIRRERRFGATTVRIGGRGRNAVLAAPYAPVLTFTHTEERTAQQLMNDVLTLNGAPLGWTVDWGLTDWLVSAGVFTHQGTWIEALAAIANAAGAYLHPHRTALSIAVRPRYPIPPWEWATLTPDLVLPDAAVVRESLRWQEKPAYNRVYVSGQQQGILGQVTRAGTAGEILAPMVVDPLVTTASAARQRGLAILADTGRQLEVTLRLPVLAETGVIEPGTFVAYQEGSVHRLGLVRSTSIEAGFPEVWQTIAVEARA